MKLVEGNRYMFMVEKEITFNSSVFFVLTGPDKQKYLLDSLEYADYNLLPGKLVDCRVDKINCQGEVFLEPEHPLYSEGKSYRFKIAGLEERIEKSGSKVDVVLLTDINGTRVAVPRANLKSSPVNPGDSVDLVVDRIIKGELKVSGESVTRHSPKEEDSRVREYFILSLSKGIDDKDYYLVKNSEDERFTLAVEYYAHYGLNIGSSFRGRLVKYKDEDRLTVEPLNPFFEPGDIYSFVVNDLIRISEEKSYLIIQDEHGFTHRTNYITGIEKGQSINCRVEKMRKGWPVLVPV